MLRQSNLSRGFTLVEMAVFLVVLGIVVSTAAMAVKRVVNNSVIEATGTSLTQVEQALMGHLMLNRQLPCPDNDNDGIGNCGARIGSIPYRDLGMGSVPVDGFSRPLTYIANGFYLTASANQYTLCQNMRSLVIGTPSRDELNSTAGASLAFAVISPGRQDLNDDDSPLDAATITPAIGSGYRLQLDASFDDRYVSKSTLTLLGKFHCPSLLVAVNSMENQLQASNQTKAALGFIKDNINDGIGNAETEILMAAFSIVAAAGDVAGAAATMIDATGQVTFFGNVPAMVGAVAAVAGAAAAVVAVVEAALIIEDANGSIADYKATLPKLDTQIASVGLICSGLRTELIAIKGAAKTCN